MWHRHRLMLPFVFGAAILLVIVGVAVGFDSAGSLIALGLAAAGVAAMATTEYRVLALTSNGLVLLRGSRVRQAAIERLDRLPKHSTVSLVGSQFLLTEWQVGDRTFSVPKASEGAMTRISLHL